MNSLYEYNEVIIQNTDAIFLNSEISKNSNSYKLLFNLSDKRNLKTSDKYIALSNLILIALSYSTWRNIKKALNKTTSFKYQLQLEIKNLKYLSDHILCQTFKIISSISSKTCNSN